MASITPQNPFETPDPSVTSNVSENVATIENLGAPIHAPTTSNSSINLGSKPPIMNNNNRDTKIPAPVTPKKNNLGLSELSKQLRALQAKNEGQAVEIDRLERQLRILADLQGISVSDLRKALSEACKSEAYEELQSRVSALRAQLDAASLAKQNSIEQDSAAHQVAHLQLRVGEMEEVEQDLRSQMKGLFDSLKEQTAKASRFETTCKQQGLEIERLRQELQKAQQQQQVQVQAPAPLVSMSPMNVIPAAGNIVVGPQPMAPQPITQQGAITTVYPPQPKTEQAIVPAPASAIVASPADMQLLAESARLAKVEAQVQQDKLTVSEKQLESTEKQYKLKQAQFKARSMVQEERIQDLEQQLSSLYVAFDMLRQEHSEGEATRSALQTSLNEADARVAQQVTENEQHVRAFPVAASPEVAPHSPTPSRSASYVSSSPGFPIENRPSMHSQASEVTQVISNHSPSVASPAPQLREDGIIMSGVILIKGSNVLRPWKKRHGTLYQGYSEFQLVISDVTSSKQDKVYTLEVGVSTLHRYATQRFAFIIRVNPYDNEAPVIYGAATSEKDYEQWLGALKLATTGHDYNPHDYNDLYGDSHMMHPSSSVNDQEDADLQAALRLSTQEM